MATETRIPGRDGTVTVVSDSYAPFGSIAGSTAPAEDPAKWEVRWLNERDVKRLCLFTDEQFATARSFLGFPTPRVVTSVDWFPRRTEQWRETVVRQWLDRVRSVNVK
jgi:hypothetical protein